MEEAQLDRVGGLKYSPVDGAEANAVATHLAREFEDRLHDSWKSPAFSAALAAKVGRDMKVLVDRWMAIPIARSEGDAPESMAW